MDPASKCFIDQGERQEASRTYRPSGPVYTEASGIRAAAFESSLHLHSPVCQIKMKLILDNAQTSPGVMF